jgi:hypothetical protein
MTLIGNNNMKKYYQLSKKLVEKGLIFGKTLETNLVSDLYKQTIEKLSAMIRIRNESPNPIFFGDGFNGKCFYSLAGTGKSFEYCRLTQMIPYAFFNQKVISIYQLIGTISAELPSVTIFHSLKEIFPHIKKKDFYDEDKSRLSLKKLLDILAKEKVFLHLIFDDVHQLYRMKKSSKILQFLEEINIFACENKDPFHFIFISGRTQLPQLIKKEDHNQILEREYFLLPHAPLIDTTKIPPFRFRYCLKMDDNFRKNVQLLDFDKKVLSDEEIYKIRIMGGDNLRRIARILSGEQQLGFQEPFGLEQDLYPLLAKIYKLLISKNDYIFKKLKEIPNLYHPSASENILRIKFPTIDEDYSKELKELSEIKGLSEKELNDVVSRFIERNLKEKRDVTAIINRMIDSHYLDEYINENGDIVYFPISVLHLNVFNNDHFLNFNIYPLLIN